MWLKIKDFGIWGFLYWGFVIAFCIGMVIYSRYTFNLDDIWMWFEIYLHQTIINNTGYVPASGRFFPLAFFDLKLLAKISTSPYLFFTINAAIVFAIALMLLAILRNALDSAESLLPPPPPIKSNASSNNTSSKYNALIFVSLLVCFLNPGFPTAMLGICYPERLEVLFLCIFLLSSLAYIRTKHIKFAIIGIISANACIYLKETAFLLVSGFSFFYLLICVLQAQAGEVQDKSKSKINVLIAKIKDCDRGILIYHSLICLSGVVFLAIYVLLVVPQTKGSYGFSSDYNLLSAITKYTARVVRIFITYISNDSFAIILLPTLIFVRMLQVVFYKKHNNANDDKSNRWSVLHPFWDSCLMAEIFCVAVYLQMSWPSTYYLLPVYFMCIGGAVYVAKSIFAYYKDTAKSIISSFSIWILRLFIALCAVIYIACSIPLGIHVFFDIKSYGVVFDDTLQFMRDYVADKPQKVDIYFEGVGRHGWGELMWHLEYFALFLDNMYRVKNFDIKSYMPNEKNVKINSKNSNSPYTYMNSLGIDTPKSGDIIILSHISKNHIDEEYINQMKQKYKLIYKTECIGLPNISMKALAKEFVYRHVNLENKDSSTDANSLKNELFFTNKNYFKLPINNYVFLVE